MKSVETSELTMLAMNYIDKTQLTLSLAFGANIPTYNSLAVAESSYS